MNVELHHGDDEADEYANNRAWADLYMPHVRWLVTKYSLVESTPFDDQHHATDLTTIHARPLDVAVRMREHYYIEKYGFEFTIRSKRVSGELTEFDKLTAGFCDWYFYGFASEETDDDDKHRVDRWVIVDLKAWRKYLIDSDTWRDSTPEHRYGVSWFFAFDLRRLPKAVVIASNFPIERGKLP
jgi:hypothetical protein